MPLIHTIIALSFILLFPFTAFAGTESSATADKEETPTAPEYDLYKKGIVYENAASSFKLNVRFRMQNRITYSDFDEDDTKNTDSVDFAVRRLRLRFEGNALDPRLLYRFQFGFSRGDMDWDTNNYPNILRDAMIGWKLNHKSTIWFGQGKLPSNRQRVISSGNQEFVDRSLLNQNFTLDRDLGLQFWQQIGDVRPLWLKFAVTNGEGRANPNNSLAISYTGRAEWLPLGEFKDKGDYSEGDLAYEETPKFSIGAVYNLNKNTSRIGGQIGKTMDNNQARDIKTVLADALLKYRGWAWSSEFAYREADNPVISADQSVYAGRAFTSQLSYVLPNQYSPAVRWTKLWADEDILSVEKDRTQYTLALTKYLQGHRVKLQGDATYERLENSLKVTSQDNWIFRIQMELGI